MYRRLLCNKNKQHGSDFPFKIPGELPLAVQKLLDQQQEERILGAGRADDSKRRPEGMNADFREQIESGEILQFDSEFESGNLDRVVMVSPTEYDLYMRPDTNTRGHHQWFYFRVTSRKNLGPVRFNILNFTKFQSLYESGMRVCVCSLKEKEGRLKNSKLNTSPLDEDLVGWKRGGYDIVYKPSKLNRIIETNLLQEQKEEGGEGCASFPRFFQVSFTYDFNLMVQDDTYFAYSFPYTFTRLSRFLKELKAEPEIMKHTKDCTPLCQSLSGVDVPYLIVTSRANEPDYEEVLASEHSPDSLPLLKTKKTIVLTGRVHPGESNSSFMMEGFIKFITSPTSPIARELRKRLVFRIIPCTNPDGVISGNYRVSMSGNDLNRRYQTPHPRLHPIVCAVKKLCRGLKPDLQTQDENQILAFIDMHGHSRKKNVFMYGPGYPIHDARYLKMRVIPKLMSEQSEMFRFYSCKFRIQKSKERTARVVLWREFNIMNCFTLEASFHGFFDRERETKEFMHSHLLEAGQILASTIFEYILMRDDEERHLKDLRAKREELKKNKAKLTAAGLPIKSKEEASGKARDGSLGGGGRAVLSPSASSEAADNIDDESPEPALANKKINHIRKKLQAQQTKKQQQVSPNKDAAQNSSQRASTSGQKKKFKLTKKFKDDVVAQKKSANPNQPPEDAEEEEDERNGQEGSSDQQELVTQSKFKTSQNQISSAPNELDFVAKFKLNRRTLADLCDQIETDEQKKKENRGAKQTEDRPDEPGTSDGGAGTDGGRAKVDAYGSDDETNGALLQQIQGKILGVLKLDASVPPAKPQKPTPSKDLKTKKTNKEKDLKKTAAKVNSQPPTKNDKKPSASLKSQVSMTKQMLISKTKDSKAPIGGERRSHQTGALLKRPDDGVPENTKERARPRLGVDQQGVPLALSSATNASAPHPPQHHYPGILLQLTNNNFNDRIMTQPYHKYKKPKYPALSSGLHQLQSLTANAHQLLQKQMQKEKANGWQRDPYNKMDKSIQPNQQNKEAQQQRPGDVGGDSRFQYSFYNYQPRNGNERSIPLVSAVGNNGNGEQGILPPSFAADGQAAERKSCGADPFGMQQSSHRYQMMDQVVAATSSVNNVVRAGRTEYQNFPKQRSNPFGNGNNIGGQVQLQSQPNLIEHAEQPQGGEVYFYHSQQCTPHLTPQLVKQPILVIPQNQMQMNIINDPIRPGQYQIAPNFQYQHPQDKNNQVNQPNGDKKETSDSRAGVSAGGMKKRNRRLLPAGDKTGGESKSGSCSVAPNDKPELLMPGNHYHDASEGANPSTNNAVADRRQKRRGRDEAIQKEQKDTIKANQVQKIPSNRVLGQLLELSGPRPSIVPTSTAQASALGRLTESAPHTRSKPATLGNSVVATDGSPTMWLDSAQQFGLGGRVNHNNIFIHQEGRHPIEGISKHQVSAQVSSTHYYQKEHSLMMPYPKPSGQMQQTNLHSRSTYASKGAGQAQQTKGDYQLLANPQQQQIDQPKNEYGEKRDSAARPQRQAHSHRREARLEYPALVSGPNSIYQTTAAIPSQQEAVQNFVNVTVNDPRSKDLEVLRSVEQAAVMLSDVPQSGSTMLKPSRASAKEQSKGQQKTDKSQKQPGGIMVRGVGAPRASGSGPYTKEPSSQGANPGLHRGSQQQQASQLSLLNDSNFQTTMYHNTGFMTRGLVANNARPQEHSNQKPYEKGSESYNAYGKPQGMLKPVVGTTNLQRKIVESAVNEKMQQRTHQLVDKQGLQRYSKMAADAREQSFYEPREQFFQEDKQRMNVAKHNSNSNTNPERDLMHNIVKSRRQQNPPQSTQPKTGPGIRSSPQTSYGGDHKAGQSFSYNPMDKGQGMGDGPLLPKTKAGTLVQTGKTQLAANSTSASREVHLRQTQNLAAFLDGDLDPATGQERGAPTGNANVFDILHRQDLQLQQRTHQPFAGSEGAAWAPKNRSQAGPSKNPSKGQLHK